MLGHPCGGLGLSSAHCVYLSSCLGVCLQCLLRATVLQLGEWCLATGLRGVPRTWRAGPSREGATWAPFLAKYPHRA
eukprot:4936566-Lingulodinium_polyedra.AAC.1